MKINLVSKSLLTGLSYMIIQKYEECDLNGIAGEIIDYLKIDIEKLTDTDKRNFKQRLRTTLNNLTKSGLIEKIPTKSAIYKNYIIYKLIKL